MLAQAGGQGEFYSQFLETCFVGSGGKPAQLHGTDSWNWRAFASARVRRLATAAPNSISLPRGYETTYLAIWDVKKKNTQQTFLFTVSQTFDVLFTKQNFRYLL